MWRRRISNWANAHQKVMIAGMFCLMACGIIWLVATRSKAQASFDDTARLLYSGMNKRQQTRSVPADMLEMWQLYSKVQTINPDSLTVQDSAFLHDIDKQLNNIIHE
ncbi:hypothetical protein CLV24_105128 [Pontibacter ummariensis]|uniref:Uncharacterized protein n=1 Tax=Pontibacter ummariensis TaxID=1610492 RepID=A0A239DV67_9BACT|nr:hypothetical protein [Pontibacter ummariensis]PRY13758.1 hypothetical protein CLV24_105128 [Pontibacter ummariensis]SNS35868.1 hypothetical protein SAMN06296052_105124 [Pontibacter ummariensis]